MKFLLLLLSMAVAIHAQDKCYSDIVSLFERKGTWDKKDYTDNCNAKYGYYALEINEADTEMQKFATKHIARSFEYLLMAANFENFEKNREGFHKYFDDLSDSKWEKSIELMKYITKRGGKVAFTNPNVDTTNEQQYESCELGSMAHALKIEKDLAQTAFDIHLKASKHLHHSTYDPEISSFIEEEFVHKQSSLIRELAGHMSDLTELHKRDTTLDVALFLFDQYLQ